MRCLPAIGVGIPNHLGQVKHGHGRVYLKTTTDIAPIHHHAASRCNNQKLAHLALLVITSEQSNVALLDSRRLLDRQGAALTNHVFRKRYFRARHRTESLLLTIYCNGVTESNSETAEGHSRGKVLVVLSFLLASAEERTQRQG